MIRNRRVVDCGVGKGEEEGVADLVLVAVIAIRSDGRADVGGAVCEPRGQREENAQGCRNPAGHVSLTLPHCAADQNPVSAVSRIC